MSSITAESYEDGSYWERNATFHDEDGEYKARQCLALLARHGLAPASIIDVGCGGGVFISEMAKATGARCVGVDLAEAAIAHARSNLQAANVDFRAGDFKTVEGRFDLVTCNDVFEHVEDYIGFLRSLRDKGSWHYFNIPLDMNVFSLLRNQYMAQREAVGHLHYFSKRSALATLDLAGFKVTGWKYNFGMFHRLRNNTGLSWKFYLALLPRAALYAVHKDFGVMLLNGASLGVLCR